jgi:hypothetical protein
MTVYQYLCVDLGAPQYPVQDPLPRSTLRQAGLSNVRTYWSYLTTYKRFICSKISNVYQQVIVVLMMYEK